MTKEGKFIVFCLEFWRLDKGISGKEALDIFDKYGVREYLRDYYDTLHSEGIEYLINDIDEFIRVRS